jgi:hypothetical protein
MILKLFLNTTDNFLCNNLKTIFEKSEKIYKKRDLEIDLFKELKNLEFNSLVSVRGSSSNFEKDVKLKLKVLLGLFFVALPLFAFVIITYLFSFEYSYAFIFTFAVALLATMRMENIIHKYAHRRYLKASC